MLAPVAPQACETVDGAQFQQFALQSRVPSIRLSRLEIWTRRCCTIRMIDAPRMTTTQLDAQRSVILSERRTLSPHGSCGGVVPPRPITPRATLQTGA